MDKCWPGVEGDPNVDASGSFTELGALLGRICDHGGDQPGGVEWAEDPAFYVIYDRRDPSCRQVYGSAGPSDLSAGRYQAHCFSDRGTFNDGVPVWRVLRELAVDAAGEGGVLPAGAVGLRAAVRVVRFVPAVVGVAVMLRAAMKSLDPDSGQWARLNSRNVWCADLWGRAHVARAGDPFEAAEVVVDGVSASNIVASLRAVLDAARGDDLAADVSSEQRHGNELWVNEVGAAGSLDLDCVRWAEKLKA